MIQYELAIEEICIVQKILWSKYFDILTPHLRLSSITLIKCTPLVDIFNSWPTFSGCSVSCCLATVTVSSFLIQYISSILHIALLNLENTIYGSTMNIIMALALTWQHYLRMTYQIHPLLWPHTFEGIHLLKNSLLTSTNSSPLSS